MYMSLLLPGHEKMSKEIEYYREIFFYLMENSSLKEKLHLTWNYKRDHEILTRLYPELKDDSEFLKSKQRLEKLKAAGVNIVSLYDDTYPPLLINRLKAKAPPLLFLRGNVNILQKRGIAIIGARNAPPEVLRMAGSFAGELARMGFAVVSGYAKGIDTMAHSGCVNVGGKTIVVLPYGIEQIRIRAELNIHHDLSNALFVSQFHPSSQWSVARAMQRNKLVVGLSEAVVVIYSNKRTGGTINAAESAIKMGVPLFVVSPEALCTEAIGNNFLITKGAKKVNTPEDALYFLNASKKTLKLF